MANIEKKASIHPLYPEQAEIRDYVADEPLEQGQPVAFLANGRIGLADVADTGRRQFRGLALNKAGPGQGVSVIHEGEVGGFDLSRIGINGFAYLGTDILQDTTSTVPVGRVRSLPDSPHFTKTLKIFTNWSANW